MVGFHENFSPQSNKLALKYLPPPKKKFYFNFLDHITWFINKSIGGREIKREGGRP